MENKIYEFMAEIKKTPDIDGAYIEFPYDLKDEFGKGRLKVRKIINKNCGDKINVKINSHEQTGR